MFIEIETTDFGIISELFHGHKQYVPVQAVIEGSYPGRIFVDNTDDPSIAIAWALGRWAYIEGSHQADKLADSLHDLINRIMIPDSRKMIMNWFELYAPNSSEWINRLDESLKPFHSKRHFEDVYIWDESVYKQFRSGYTIPDELILKIDDLFILPNQICETPFIADFFKSRKVIGCAAKMDDKVVSICRSNGLASGNEFMIDVVTPDPDFRGMGYATAASVGLLDYCLKSGLIPLWETTEDNLASQRLAKKLGFIASERYPVYAIEF